MCVCAQARVAASACSCGHDWAEALRPPSAQAASIIVRQRSIQSAYVDPGHVFDRLPPAGELRPGLAIHLGRGPRGGWPLLVHCAHLWARGLRYHRTQCQWCHAAISVRSPRVPDMPRIASCIDHAWPASVAFSALRALARQPPPFAASMAASSSPPRSRASMLRVLAMPGLAMVRQTRVERLRQCSCHRSPILCCRSPPGRQTHSSSAHLR